MGSCPRCSSQLDPRNGRCFVCGQTAKAPPPCLDYFAAREEDPDVPAALALNPHAAAALFCSFTGCGLAIGIALLEPPPYFRLPCVPVLAGLAITAIILAIRLLGRDRLTHVNRTLAVISLLLSLLDLYAAWHFLRPSLT